MIVFKKVYIQNFLSFGEEVEIGLNECGITAIRGSNGVGKSSILDAIYFGLYGKSFRGVNLRNLVNTRYGKNCLVKLDLEIGGKEYRVVRGISPSVFEIYMNGELKNISADNKTYQKNFVTDVLKIDERTFRQLVVIGSSSYIPFLELSVGDRRVVIEQLLRLDIFAKMNMVVTDKLNLCSDKLVAADNNKRVAEEKYSLAKKMHEEDVNEYREQCKVLKEQNEELKKKYLEIPDVSDKIEEIRLSQKEIQGKISEIENDKSKKSAEVSTIDKYVEFFQKNRVCPLCHQKPEDNFLDGKEKDKQLLKKSIDKLTQDIEKFRSSYSELDKQLSEFLDIVDKKNKILSLADSNKRQIKKYIELINKKKEVNNLDELKSDIEKYSKEYDNIYKINSSLAYVKSILKDDGVKKIIINRYLQKLNESIRYYLDLINMPIVFSLNNKFEEEVTSSFSSGKDYQLENFSEGEKLRINISIMFALRDFSKTINSISTNLLFLDEFDSGVLDEDGLKNMQDIILSLKNCNVFIISHNVENFETISNRVLTLSKNNGITCIGE